MEKKDLQCPKCESNSVVRLFTNCAKMKHCNDCGHRWEIPALNTWRMDYCDIKTSPNTQYEFLIVFDDGKKLTTHIDPSSHLFEGLNKIKQMFQAWNNGDHIYEPALPSKVNDVNTDGSYIEGVNATVAKVYKAIQEQKRMIIDNNPTPNHMSSTREGALVILDVLRKNILALLSEPEESKSTQPIQQM